MASAYIKEVNVNLFNGVLHEKIHFNPKLNIISGDNGTGKTQLLTFIKNNINNQNFVIVEPHGSLPRITAFSPKRNATKQAITQILQAIRTQAVDLNKLDQQLLQQQFQDTNFINYRSFGEYFVVILEDKVREGNITYMQALDIVRKDFDEILSMIFPGYRLDAMWEHKNPNIYLRKNEHRIPLHQLSCGENEVLSLIFNVYGSRDRIDIFLIDEPELHLNWRLESGLFDFLKWFADKFAKQIIVSTHSRVIFQEKYRENRIFLKWHGAKIIHSHEVDDEIRRVVAGDAINIINGLSLSKTILFVEDNAHKHVYLKIAKLLGKDIDVRVENGRGNVEKLCKILANERIHNCLFVIDNDNKPADPELLANTRFVQLAKYCIENYFLDTDILKKISGGRNVLDLLMQAIKECNNHSFRVFHKLIDNSIPIDESLMATLDGSLVLKKLSPKLGFKNQYGLMEKYLEQAYSDGMLETMFSEIISKL